ncbi:MAG: DUF4445 domain-containing protein [Ruminococcaceae bacterium]|nr:DUF4445 domain-containing protein [Oscillospiraceae bacterium]
MNANKQTVTLTVDGGLRQITPGQRLSSYLTGELPCGGHGKCGKCKVIAKGELSAVSQRERELLSEEELARGVRLSCLTEVLGDCLVETDSPPKGRVQILTEGWMPEVGKDPFFTQYGIAIDIGSTTLAARLYDTEGTLLSEVSRLNPQASFGADVVSRIEAALDGRGNDLKQAILAALDEMITQLAERAGVSAETVDGIVITGNTVMLHLLTGTSPEPLSHAPFVAERLFGEECTAAELALSAVLPEAKVYLPPCIAAFVGADTVCALLATGLCVGDQTKLMVDIGTNGEMGLWHNGALFVCSTAAGPAFEGVGISMGMRGTDGAIDRVWADGESLAVHVLGETQAKGICGSGLVDAIATLLKLEWLDETGYLDDAPISLTKAVTLTQEDVRMVQLAKSAICAGIGTLLRVAGADAAEVPVTEIAGGFGYYLNMANAAAIGLLPPALEQSVRAVGNAALSGAAMLLLDRTLQAECAELAHKARVVELASNPIFSELYMMGMMFE